MASSINASTSGGGGVITTADSSGNLNIQSGGSTVVGVTSTGATVTGTLAATGASTFTGTGKFATTIGVGNATPAASGAGITFPATQSASSDANTLDDYEEGTWTPNQGSGLTLVGAFSSSGSYTKTGRQVTVIFQVTGATTVAAAGGGATICTNLPFTQAVNSPVGTVGDNQTASVSGVFYIGSNICFTNTTLTAKNQYLFVATYFIA